MFISPTSLGAATATGIATAFGLALVSHLPASAQEFGAAVAIIELTEEDIELQIFVDGVEWDRLKILDPDGRDIVTLAAQSNLRRQDGFSEMFFASEPTHFLEDDPVYDGPVEEFLARFPEGEYAFKGTTAYGQSLAGVATLTHVMPALPEVVSPTAPDEEIPEVDRDNVVIEWEPVTGTFFGDGEVEVIEYQVIIEQEEPKRDAPWVNGSTRGALINVPGSVTRLVVPPEMLVGATEYAYEILAIEASGNASITSGEFTVE